MNPFTLLLALATLSTEGADLEERVLEHRLANGWTFLLLPRHQAPVVSFQTYVDVGAVNERPGITGMAHMFEHMAFKGSDRVGSKSWEQESAALARVEQTYLALAAARAAGDAAQTTKAELAYRAAEEAAAKLVEPEEYSRILEDAGGAQSLNAWTSCEETCYVVSLPKNRIELWCWTERERFARLVLREFYKERDVVLEERNMSVDSSPGGLMYEKLLDLAFEEHPYRSPVIGRRADLTSFTQTDAERFFREHYGARRFVTAIVGDFEPAAIVPLLERYFGDLPSGPEAAPIGPAEPAQTEERRASVAFPAEPMLMLGWKVPESAHPDNVVVDVCVRLLGETPGARLPRRLVREDALALDVSIEAGWPGTRWPNLVGAFALPAAGHTTAELEAAIDEEVARLAREGPAPEELAGVIRRARAELLRGMRSNAGLASRLCESQAKEGGWRAAFRRADRIAAVTAEDVKRVAGAYLVPARRTVVTLAPAETTEEQP